MKISQMRLFNNKQDINKINSQQNPAKTESVRFLRRNQHER